MAGTPESGKHFSRREFLKYAITSLGSAAVAGGVGYYLGARGGRSVSQEAGAGEESSSAENTPETQSTQTPAVKEPLPIITSVPKDIFEEDTQSVPGKLEAVKQPEDAALKIKFGKEQKVDFPELSYYPDGHICFLRQGNDLRMIVSSDVSSYILEGKVAGRWVGDLKIINNKKPVFGPNPQNKWEKDYAAITSFVKDGKGGYVGAYHAEDRDRRNDGSKLAASIGLCYSKDLVNWERRGKVLEGVNSERTRDFWGIGHPMLFDPQGDYYYMYYLDWTFGTDAIHMSRCLKSEIGNPNAWQKWTRDGFAKSGEMGRSDPVIDPSEFGKDASYTALPSISYNRKLGKYLAIVQAGDFSFGSMVSGDGIKWQNPQILLNNNAPKYKRWLDYYPSLLSFDEASDQITNDQGALIYASTDSPNKPHAMFFRAWKIE